MIPYNSRMRSDKNVFLIGFSGTGKSSVGRKLAVALGWRFLDIDSIVAHRANRSIAEIFATEGEAYFRRLESAELAAASALKQVVVATGGGAVVERENRRRMAQTGWLICLEATPETILARLDGEGELPPVEERRPLLEGGNRLLSIAALKRQRQQFYALADWTIHTDLLTVEQTVGEIKRAVDILDVAGKRRSVVDHGEATGVENARVVPVTTSSASYNVVVGAGLLNTLPKLMSGLATDDRHVFLISDGNVAPLYMPALRSAFEAGGWRMESFIVPAGELSKSLATASQLYDWLIGRSAERIAPVVALGGGVIGDLGGFVASTYLRGVTVVQVPTSLLAMVDSSVGGKTAVNHPLAKNSIGTFYQPSLVLADTSTLRSLPERELVSGWAECVKTAMIAADSGALFEFLEQQSAGLRGLEAGLVAEVVQRCVAVKADVVGTDEREMGRRTVLNYGHTIGHALEAAGGFQRFLHGEAVAIGMHGAARIAERLGMAETGMVERQVRLLRALGLPADFNGLDRREITAAVARDKKSRSGRVRWVLPVGISEVQVVDGVPVEVVEEVLAELQSPPSSGG